MNRLIAPAVALVTALFAAPAAHAVAVINDATPKRVPSVSTSTRIESLEKEAAVRVYDGPRGFHTGVDVLFDRKGTYGNPELVVTLDLWAYTFINSLYFDDQPGPVSGPAV